EALQRHTLPGAEALLDNCDLLVDGPYIEQQASQKRRYIGSDNQRIHFLSDFYRSMEGAWPVGDHGLELRLGAEGISINGHPRDELIALAASLRFASAGEPATSEDAG